MPDELAWLSRLAGRFGVTISPHASVLFAEVAERCFAGLAAGALAERAPLPERAPYEPPAPATTPAAPALPAPDEHFLGDLRVVRYRPLFSGPLVERVPELEFQRPAPEIELAAEDAERRAIATGDTLEVRSNGTSVRLRARVNRKLMTGVVRLADEHAGELHAAVEVVKP